ncbi:hypothetical protein [Pontibacter pamirensis]|uniref:hypothetical protein n=1 Tax=Pontibacter pamirensis TaxID=2562824 RepID=UPI00192E460B|nr:hypothetical protein [Pontibacter pamirensis]
MKTLIPLALILVLVTGCDGDSNYASSDHELVTEDEYSDGTYCAEVDYYNPNTGTSSTYTLEVEIEGNELTTIHWPSGGWLDDSHFSSTDISNGYASFTSDRGYHYTVTITGEGGSCYTDNYVDEAEEEESYINEEDESYMTEEEDTYLMEEESAEEAEY